MKIRKILALIFNIMLVCSLFVFTNVSASAQTEMGLEFSLTNENGESVITVNPGDEITVYFNMKRTDSSENYSTNGFQNYIHYDLSFFEFVEGSITCFDTGSASAKKQTSLTYGEIIQCQNMANSYLANFVFCTFKLKVIATSGSGVVYNDEIYAFNTAYEAIPVTKVNLKASICKHTSKTLVGAKAPTCTEKGWDAYQDCDDCSLFFDATGEIVIDEIPYHDPTGHSQEANLSFDESGHWYACANCDERLDYADHAGGEATCSAKAVCLTCGQAYGEFDSTNHDKSDTISFDENGHWYDCANCDEKLEYALHAGGEATCSAKAVCLTCSQAYGEFDSTNHDKTDVLKFDENGHWYACANCTEKLDYAPHAGGEATCTAKARCSTCNEAYGGLDGNNHGALTVVNYDENGHWFSCSDCGTNLTYEAHSGGEATCTAKAVCLTCNQPYGELDSTNHDKSDTISFDENGHWYDCANCSEKLEYASHAGGEATCTAKAICSTCKQAYGEIDSANHNLSQTISFDESGHWYDCADCGKKLDYAVHAGGEATCSAKAICSTCNQAYGELDALNHGDNMGELEYDENGHWSVCSACGVKDYEEHSGGVATCGSQAQCNVCKQHYGSVDAENHLHTYVVNYKFAWFFGNGYSGDVHCSDCEQLIQEGEVISMFDIGRWPWWVILISIPLFPIILIVWIFLF